jgi:hypothetical protein
MGVIQHAKGMIRELEMLLPDSPDNSFRERLVAHLEELESRKTPAGEESQNVEFRLKARTLLVFYEKIFGVKDLVDMPDEE